MRPMIGQMFLAGFDGCEVDEQHWIIRSIRQDRLGGVILFDRNVDGSVQNIRSPEQLRRLTRALQEHAEIPLLIAVDQEGGRVCRLKERDGFPPSLSAAELGNSSLAETQQQAGIMAATMAAHGINLNLAPVVDLDLNPDNPIIGRYQRCFSAVPQEVVRHARAFIRAHHRYGIACCLKHFPGHGSAGHDSHFGFVDCTEEWHQSELIPFQELIRAGCADAVMTAHLVQRHLDPEGLPATLSAGIVRSLLRRELGFTGVIITDDLQMRAITDHWGFVEAVQRAVLAGIDLLIVGNNLVRQPDCVARGIRAIEELVDSGRIDADDITRSVQRIRGLKQNIARC